MNSSGPGEVVELDDVVAQVIELFPESFAIREFFLGPCAIIGVRAVPILKRGDVGVGNADEIEEQFPRGLETLIFVGADGKMVVGFDGAAELGVVEVVVAGMGSGLGFLNGMVVAAVEIGIEIAGIRVDLLEEKGFREKAVRIVIFPGLDAGEPESVIGDDAG